MHGLLKNPYWVGLILLINSVQTVAGVTHSRLLEEQPIIVQALKDPSDREHLKIIAKKLIADRKTQAPKLFNLWKKSVKSPASEPILVGTPNFVFPDTWPNLLTGQPSPENSLFSEKYSNFQKSHKKRDWIVYQIDRDFVLHGWNLFSGEQNIQIPLLDFVSSTEVENSQQHLPPELHVSDVFMNFAWHTIMMIIIGNRHQHMICLDVTHPKKLQSKNISKLILWSQTKESSYFTQPYIIRTFDGSWQTLVYRLGHNSNSVTLAKIIGLNVLDGVQLAEYPVPQESSIQFKSIGKIEHQGSTMAPIDSNNQGFADKLYFGDEQGRLWYFSLLPLQYRVLQNKGQFTLQSKRVLFNNTLGGQFGAILSQPKVIKHLSGDKLIVSTLIEHPFTHDTYILNLLDRCQKVVSWSDVTRCPREPTQLEWFVDNRSSFVGPIIIHNRLITADGNFIRVFDLHKGKLQVKEPIQWIGESPQICKPNNLISNILVYHSLGNKPKLVLVFSKVNRMGWARINIEHDELARRVWREIRH